MTNPIGTPGERELIGAKRNGFFEAAEEVMHFINALDSEGMDANAVRSAIYHKCLEMRPLAATALQSRIEEVAMLREALGKAVEIIDKHVPEDALGTNWEGNDEVPGGVHSWPIKEEYLHYMREALANVPTDDVVAEHAKIGGSK